MKIRSGCIPCTLERALFECELAIQDDLQRISALMEIMEFMLNQIPSLPIPAMIGSYRQLIIKRRSGLEDMYSQLKFQSNQLASSLLPQALEFYSSSQDKLRALFIIIAAANAMEYGVRGHRYHHAGFQLEFREPLGDLPEATARIQRYTNILYILDNAGEAIFDLWAAGELHSLGKKLMLAAKSSPILNDVTLAELRQLGYAGEAASCGEYVGVWLDQADQKFLERFWSRDWLIIAKGMGNYETLSELQDQLRGRLIYVLMAKCAPVAQDLGVPQGSLVVKPV